MIESMVMKEERVTDERLLAEFAAQGSQEAFAELVSRHSDVVYSVCRRVLGDPASAEDAAQAAFLVFFQKARTLDPGTVLSSWLYRVAELCARDMGRARQRRARHEREAMAHKQATDVFSEDWEEVRPHLDAALAALPAAQRDVLILRYIQGLSREEMAQTLSCAVETIHKRLSRALESLRSRLRRAGVFVPAVALTAFLSERAVEAAPRELAASITKTCLAKAVRPGLGAVAKHVAAKLSWTPLKITVLAAGVAAAVLLPAAYLALRREAATQTAPPPEIPLVSTAPATQAASPQEQDNEGRHLDDPTVWVLHGELPMEVTPKQLRIHLKNQNPEWRVAGISHRRVDLSQGEIRLAFSVYPPKGNPLWSFDGWVILPSVANSSRSDPKPAIYFQYDKGNRQNPGYGTLITCLGEVITGRPGPPVLDKASHIGEPVDPGEGPIKLEWIISRTEFCIRVNGQSQARRLHGAGPYAYISITVGSKDCHEDLSVVIQDVSVEFKSSAADVDF